MLHCILTTKKINLRLLLDGISMSIFSLVLCKNSLQTITSFMNGKFLVLKKILKICIQKKNNNRVLIDCREKRSVESIKSNIFTSLLMRCTKQRRAYIIKIIQNDLVTFPSFIIHRHCVVSELS